MKYVIGVIVFGGLSFNLYAQDTTGGTRPNIVIPLHRVAKTQAAQEPGGKTVATKEPAVLTADDVKLRAAARKKSRHAKRSRKTTP